MVVTRIEGNVFGNLQTALHTAAQNAADNEETTARAQAPVGQAPYISSWAMAQDVRNQFTIAGPGLGVGHHRLAVAIHDSAPHALPVWSYNTQFMTAINAPRFHCMQVTTTPPLSGTCFYMTIVIM